MDHGWPGSKGDHLSLGSSKNCFFILYFGFINFVYYRQLNHSKNKILFIFHSLYNIYNNKNYIYYQFKINEACQYLTLWYGLRELTTSSSPINFLQLVRLKKYLHTRNSDNDL